MKKKYKIIYKDPKKLKNNKANARVHSYEQIEMIKNSIQEWGFTNPILIDEKNEIIAGHGRKKAAEILCLEEVPTIKLENLTEVQKKAYMIADNQIALNSTWNDEQLRITMQALDVEKYNLNLLGFPDYEIDNFLAESADTYIGEHVEKELPQALQMIPPREYVLIMCKEDNSDWEKLKEALDLKPVRKGGYKKNSPLDAISTERVLKAQNLLQIIENKKC